MHPQYQSTLQNILSWSQANTEIQGVIIIGSQARDTLLPDQWSDLDLMVFVDDQQRMMADNTWFERFGSVVCHFDEIVPLHFTNWSWCVKRVLYDDHRDVDFSVLPYAQLDEVLEVNKDILSKGCRVVYDPRADLLERKIAALLQAVEQRETPVPSAEELHNVVSELLYHVIWAFKKIKRKELWIAVNCINSHMKNLLLWLIEAHNASIGERPDFLMYSGRFLEQRADPDILAKLKDCFTKYDETEAIAALEHLFEITYLATRQICEHNGYPFNAVMFEQIKKIYDDMKATGQTQDAV